MNPAVGTNCCSVCSRAMPHDAGRFGRFACGGLSCASCDQLLQLIRLWFPNQRDIDTEEITFQASFYEDLGCDSLDTTELIVVLETELKLTLPDGAPERLKTVGDLVRLVDAHRAA